jgi:hypothetical protein
LYNANEQAACSFFKSWLSKNREKNEMAILYSTIWLFVIFAKTSNDVKAIELNSFVFLHKSLEEMTTIEKIKKEITGLSVKDFQTLRQWIADKDWNNWDNEIVKDSESGKLDFLVKEADEEAYSGKLKNL